jgi:uncharacterized glyoxalase superfamily protein PhnB
VISKTTPSTVIPTLRYSDAKAAIDWLCEAFGFEKHLVVVEGGNRIAHAQLTFGSGMIMLGSIQDNEYGRFIKQPNEMGGYETQAPYLIVDNVDAHYDHAKSFGAVVMMEPEDQPHGGRFYTCKDLEGHLWNFGSYDPWEN